LAQSCSRLERPALFDPSDLTRILGVAESSTYRLQMERVHGGVRQHAATTAHLIRNAQLCNGHVVRPTVSHRVGADPMPWFSSPFTPRIERAVLASTAFGARFFGHWLLDDIPLTLAAKRVGEAINVMTELSPHQQAYAEMMGANSRSILHAQVKELIIIDDLGQNHYKADRLKEMRARLLKRFPSPVSNKVMLLRKNTGKSRLLVNEMEIAERLADQGFQIISPLETSAEELVRACLGAQVVVGVEGSHLTHGLLCMAPGTTVLAIHPPERFDAVLKDWCDCKQVRYAFVVGEPCEKGGFTATHQQIDCLLQTVC
jgi:capsular polysaccharide biosynthesis protein